MSADDRFDELGKALAASTSRRKFLKVAAAAAAGAVLSVVRAPEAAASHNRRCREPGANCSSNAECCTHFCDPNFHCACAVPCAGVTKGAVDTDCCAPGDVCCPGNGSNVPAQCVNASKTLCPTGQSFSSTTCKCEAPCTKTCTAPLVLNTTTCQCECPTAQVCGSSCCGAGQVCCGTTCCEVGAVCCATGTARQGQCGRLTGDRCGSNNQCCSNQCTGIGSNKFCA
jgi:hypothetical protein